MCICGISSGKTLQTLHNDIKITSILLTPDRLFATDDKQLFIYDYKSLLLTMAFPNRQLIISGKPICAISSLEILDHLSNPFMGQKTTQDGTWRFWNYETGALVNVKIQIVECFLWRSYVAVISTYEIILLNLNTQKSTTIQHSECELLESKILVHFTEDGRLVIGASNFGIKIFQLSSGNLLRKIFSTASTFFVHEEK